MRLEQLNFHHLFYFWRVAKLGHLTRAAEEVHASQSALSAQIRQLEERLGEPLFTRENRRMVLTEQLFSQGRLDGDAACHCDGCSPSGCCRVKLKRPR